MPISCHFQDCEALLFMSSHVSSAISSIQTFTFTFTCITTYSSLLSLTKADDNATVCVYLFVCLLVGCFMRRIMEKVTDRLKWNFYWANLKIIKFWAPNPPRRCPQRGNIFSRWFGNRWHSSRAIKLSRTTGQATGIILGVKPTPQDKGSDPDHQFFFIFAISTLQPYTIWRGDLPWRHREF